MRLFALPPLTLILILALPVFASDGRIEINQVSVEAAGGFPFTISSPGNYLLTSDLAVPADTDAFVLETSEVVFDLNGFSIRGLFSCNVSACAVGTGSAFRPGFSVAFGRDTTVRNGRVSGFGASCVALSSSASVTGLMVSHCGRVGIGVSSGSIVTSNRVTRTGEQGIRMSGTTHPPTFERNAVSFAGLGGGGFRAVSGGRASGGNSCDDGSCTPHGERRYYLTPATFNGAQANNPGNCAAGFHFASLWEIFDTSSLRYDTALGVTLLDSGQGPPQSNGWIRTGAGSEIHSVGEANCSAWATTGIPPIGTTVSPERSWRDPGFRSSPWGAGFADCSSLRPIWCVEE